MGDPLKRLQGMAQAPPGPVPVSRMFESAAPTVPMDAPGVPRPREYGVAGAAAATSPYGGAPHATSVPAFRTDRDMLAADFDIERGSAVSSHAPPAAPGSSSVVRITIIAAVLAMLGWAIKVFFGAKRAEGANRVRTGADVRDFVYDLESMARATESDDEAPSPVRKPRKPRRKHAPGAATQSLPVDAESAESARGLEDDGSAASSLANDPLYCFFDSQAS